MPVTPKDKVGGSIPPGAGYILLYQHIGVLACRMSECDVTICMDRNNRILTTACVILSALMSGEASAHHPVMDAEPRGVGGVGFQMRYESVSASTLEQDGSEISNSQGLEYENQTRWLEGVYTFNRTFHTVFKIPIENKKGRLQIGTQVKDLKASGLGDVTLSFPFSRYSNRMGFTSHMVMAPHLLLPTGSTGGDLPLGRGTAEYGLAFAYDCETPRLYGRWETFVHAGRKGDDDVRRGNLYGFDMGLGGFPIVSEAHEFSVKLTLETHVRVLMKDKYTSALSTSTSGASVVGHHHAGYYAAGQTVTYSNDNTGGKWIEMAPSATFYFRNMGVRLETFFPVYRKLNGTQLVNDWSFQFTVGMTLSSLFPWMK